MKAIAMRKIDGWCPVALVLAAAILSPLVLPRCVLADDAVRKKSDADLEKFLQRIRDVDDVQAKEQIRDKLLRKAWGAEPRQFEWDAVDRPRQNDAVGKLLKPAAEVQIQRLELKGLQARTLMVFSDGEVRVTIEAVLVPDENEEEDAPLGGQPRQKQQLRIAPGSIEQLVFGKGRDEVQARQQLVELLSQKIARINRTCELSEAQSQKLKLAGRGDIHRFFDQAGILRSKFEAIGNFAAGERRELLQKVMAITVECRPLRAEFDGGPFGEGSLFAKALHRMLTPAQAARYDGAESSAN